MTYSNARDVPEYEHDCDNCIFLGNLALPPIDALAKNYDLYVCEMDGILQTIVARYSDNPSDYISGDKLNIHGLGLTLKELAPTIDVDQYFAKEDMNIDDDLFFRSVD